MRKNQKGTTIIEVVISFAMISMSFAIGMVGIACGSSFLNSGAKLKNEQRSKAVVQMTSIADETITVKADGTTTDIAVLQYSSGNFVRYAPKS